MFSLHIVIKEVLNSKKKKLLTKEILNTVCHINFLFITVSTLWVLLVQTLSGEHCRNVQIIINSMCTIGYYWNKLLQDTLSFLHFIFGLVRLISLAVLQCQ
jgi:DeoR/GlpR family transcriptional regulator of sugar metabolism